MKHLISPFIYLISLLFIKKANRWCFGSWFGNKYDDNTKYLFERLKNDTDVDAYWVTSNKEVYNALLKKGYKTAYSFSFKGIYIQLTTKVFICTVNSKDFYYPTITRRNIFIQTWHGMPLKKIGFDISSPSTTRLINIIRWFLIDNYDYVISASPLFDTPFKSAMRITDKNIIRSQNARCDGFNITKKEIKYIRQKLGIEDHNKFILYLPTHRNEGADVNVIHKAYMDLLDHEHFLKENHIHIIIKLHPYDMKHKSNFHIQSENISLANESEIVDLYKVLAASDALITDYSSVMFEYITLQKPLLFYAPDLDNYIKNERGLYFNFNELIPNPIYDISILLDSLSHEKLRPPEQKFVKKFNEIDTKNISATLIKTLKEYLLDD